jgi:pre-mRNA-processing factor 19
MARHELDNVKKMVGEGRLKTDAGSALPGLDGETRNKLMLKSQELSKLRQNRSIPTDLPAPPQLKAYSQQSSHPPHKVSSPGILSVDLHPSNQELTLTGGVDKTAVLFNFATGKKVSTLSGHTKKVTSTLFHPVRDVIITASADSTVRVWQNSSTSDAKVKYTTAHTLTQHTGEIVQCSLHATHDYVVAGSADRSWSFSNLSTGQALLQVNDPDDSPLTCCMLHPDGLILATGSEGNVIRIWDLKSQKNVVTFEGHKGHISDLCFSENGYYLTTAALDEQLKLWDLRGPKNINSIKLDAPIRRMTFDHSGTYLAAAIGKEIRIFTGKQLSHVTTLDDHTGIVTDVKFGNKAKFLASTSMDRTLKIWY